MKNFKLLVVSLLFTGACTCIAAASLCNLTFQSVHGSGTGAPCLNIHGNGGGSPVTPIDC